MGICVTNKKTGELESCHQILKEFRIQSRFQVNIIDGAFRTVSMQHEQVNLWVFSQWGLEAMCI